MSARTDQLLLIGLAPDGWVAGRPELLVNTRTVRRSRCTTDVGMVGEETKIFLPILRPTVRGTDTSSYEPCNSVRKTSERDVSSVSAAHHNSHRLFVHKTLSLLFRGDSCVHRVRCLCFRNPAGRPFPGTRHSQGLSSSVSQETERLRFSFCCCSFFVEPKAQDWP
jgi:hypothetical protein